jgi:predicted SpoU family rRNA methylase
MTTMEKTVKDFIEEHGFTMEAEKVSSNPNMIRDSWSEKASHWAVTIYRAKTTEPFGTYFSQGSAVEGAPTLEDVLDSLAREANLCYENSNELAGFAEWIEEGWAGEINPDTIKQAVKQYRNGRYVHLSLQGWMGNDLYEELTTQTERL